MYDVQKLELTQISPKNYSLKGYKYLRSKNIVLVTLSEDSNNDLAFDNKDKEILYKIDLDNLNESRELYEIKIKTK